MEERSILVVLEPFVAFVLPDYASGPSEIDQLQIEYSLGVPHKRESTLEACI